MTLDPEHTDTLRRWVELAAGFDHADPPPAPVREWIDQGTPVTLERDDVLTMADLDAPAPPRLILSGLMGMRVHDDTASVLTQPCFHGAFLGIEPGPGPTGRNPHQSRTFEALTPVVTWSLPRAGFEAFDHDPDCQAYFLRRAHKDLNLALNMLALSRNPDTHRRMARNLVLLAGVAGQRIEDTLAVPIRQQTLGDMTGLSRERTSKAMAWFKERQILETGYEKIYVHDEGGLLGACGWRDSPKGDLTRIHTLEERLA